MIGAIGYRADVVSLRMHSIFTVGVVPWLVYGLVVRAWSIDLANANTPVLVLFILAMKIRYG